MAQLPQDVGARLVVWQGGASILGVSFREERTIAINARAVGSLLEVPVILHEAAHLLSEPAPMALCDTRWRPMAIEMLAWAGAGRLCVSDAQIRLIDERWASCEEIAQDNAVPPALVALGRAVHRRSTGLEQKGEYDFALAAWRYAMTAAVALL